MIQVCVCVCVLNHTTSTPTATLCALHYHQKTAGLSVPSTLLRPRSNDFPKTMTLYWVLYLWGTVVLFMSLEEKEGGESHRQKRNKKKEAEYFIDFIISLEKHQESQTSTVHSLKIGKLSDRPTKHEGAIRLTRCIKQHSRHITIYMKQQALRRVQEQSHNVFT